MRHGVVYEIRNARNGKRYVGSSINFQKRKEGHLYKLRANKHHSGHLQAAWNADGEASFSFGVLLVCASKDLFFYEQLVIDAFDSCGDAGYNIAKLAGTTRGTVVWSQEQREEMAMRTKSWWASLPEEKKARWSMPLSDETKRKMSEARRGRVCSEETKRAISEKNRGKGPSAAALEAARAYNTGRKQSPDVVERRAEKLRGKKRPAHVVEKVRAALLGSKLSPEHRASISAALTGRKVPAEVREKMSASIRAAIAKKKAARNGVA